MNTLLEKAITAARDAGKEILSLYATTDFERKIDGSPVTIADSRSNEILLRHLQETGIPILSEESTGVPIPYPRQMWIIDPLDGTKDFIKKTNDFSVMIGLLEEGHSTLGVVYAPVSDTLYYAEKNKGAYVVRNGMTTKLVTGLQSNEPLRFICSVNNFAPYMEDVAHALSAVKTPHGSVGIKTGLIGENKGEFFFSKGNFGEWDVCGPEIIMTEAGGHVSDCNGNPLIYGALDHRVEHGIVFSNTLCHEQVLTAIKEAKVTELH